LAPGKMRAILNWLLLRTLLSMFEVSEKLTENDLDGQETSMPGNQAKGVSCLLDTDIVIDYLQRREYAYNLLEKWAAVGLLAVSTLSHLEVYQGMKSGKEKATGIFLDGLVSIAVDISIARKAGSIIGDYRSKGMTVGTGDAIIAATALQMGVPLLTNNVEHYPFSGLRVVRGRQ
jgi:predicted nucleic acid-binding protein